MRTQTGLEEAIEAARTFFDDPSITKKTVWKRSKMRRFVRIRFFICAYLRAKDPKRYSYPVIANAIKMNDHTTCIHGVTQAHERWGADLFIKLAAIRVVANVGAKCFSPTRREIVRIGEANMRIMKRSASEAAA